MTDDEAGIAAAQADADAADSAVAPLTPADAAVPVAEAPAAALPQTAGAQLARARESAGLTRADVANKLKFSVKQIESVEADNYTTLGGKTFVRGLVRTYAKLLAIDASPVLAALDSSGLPPETGQVVANPKGVPFPTAAPAGNPVLRYAVLSFGLIALGILLLYLWHGEELLSGPAAPLPVAKPQTSRPDSALTDGAAGSTAAVNLTPTVVDAQPAASAPAPTAAAAPEAVTARPAAAPLTAVPSAAVAPVTTTNTANNAGEKKTERAVAAAAAPLAQAAAPVSVNVPASPRVAGGSGRRILMAFDRDSWVEVKDGSGRVVFSQLNLGGTTQVIEGRAPFDVVIGNAGHVSVHYRDAPVDLRPYIKSDVARISLN